MNSQHLQNRLTEIQGHIDDFKKKLVDSEDNYNSALKLFIKPELKSSFMEQHIIHTKRQKLAITRMEELYSKVQDQLSNL